MKPSASIKAVFDEDIQASVTAGLRRKDPVFGSAVAERR
jgi:hypothetical protein